MTALTKNQAVLFQSSIEYHHNTKIKHPTIRYLTELTDK